MKTATAIIFFVIALGYVGQGDYEDALKQREHYCSMVTRGVYPDYDQEIECEAVEE
jgi:hypothetical protein